MVKIRKYTGKGSTVTTHVLEEAERIAADAWGKGCLVVAEGPKEMVLRGEPLKENETYTLVPPIAGG